MLGRGVWVGLGLSTLSVANPAAAQGNLDHGKTAVQLYASACATCHESPQGIPPTKSFFGLESFLRQHYTSSSESAAILAAYLKGQQKRSAGVQPARAAKPMSQPNTANVTVNEFGEEIGRTRREAIEHRRGGTAHRS